MPASSNCAKDKRCHLVAARVTVTLGTPDGPFPFRHGTLGKLCDERVDQGGVEMTVHLNPFVEVIERVARVIDEPFGYSGYVCFDHFQCKTCIVLGETRDNSSCPSPTMVVKSKIERKSPPKRAAATSGAMNAMTESSAMRGLPHG